MVFSSLTFLFLFLPIVLIGYYLLPKKAKIAFLLLASLVFYAWGEPVYVLLMIGSILLNWLIGLCMDRTDRHKKAWLILSVVLNIALLFVFKYAELFWNTVRGVFPAPLSEKTVSIRLPIGISFFTFQIMSYVIDLYRGKTGVQRNPIRFGAYVAMFPQLIAGPIVRYVDIEAQLSAPDISLGNTADGVRRFTVGLAKKVLLANALGLLWERFSASPTENGVLGAWIGLLAYTFQIYFDFSGYSDMACGLGRMLGFRFVENFNYPYISDSITDFWRRWHISLSSWFREYVYIPLGGNRRGKGRQILNLLIVWLLTGLWHGASWTFVIWGLYYGVLLILEKLFVGRLIQKLPRALRTVYAFVLVMIGWCVFALPELPKMLTYLGTLFGLGSGGWISPLCAAWTVGYLPTFLLAAFAASPLGAAGKKKLERFSWFPAVQLAGTLLLFVLCIASLASQSYNPFIYFRF